jgi:hypothetical protein
VIAACALKCLGGSIQGRLWPRNDDERRAALDQGYDLDKVLTLDDLVSGDDVFFAATGITDGELLRGVRLLGRRRRHAEPRHALKSGTIRMIEAQHRWTKLSAYSAVKYSYVRLRSRECDLEPHLGALQRGLRPRRPRRRLASAPRPAPSEARRASESMSRQLGDSRRG